MNKSFLTGFVTEIEKLAAWPLLLKAAPALIKPALGGMASGAAMAVGANAVSSAANKLSKPRKHSAGAFNYGAQ